jgi:release factor family 10
MLSNKDLIELERALRDRTVLSVYVNGQTEDPASRRRWRIELRHSFDDIASWLEGSSHAEREAFIRCRELIVERLDQYRGTVRSPGWAGFCSTDGVYYASALPVPMPTMAVWSSGPCLTPYLRALKEARAVIVAVVDSRKARLFRYVGRHVERLHSVHAHAHVEPIYHLGQPPRLGFHGGTRGPTGADEAQRELRQGTAHMLTELSEEIGKLAGADGWIVIGGIPSVAKAALKSLPDDLAVRATHAETLDIHATHSHVAEAARLGASSLRDLSDAKRVNEALAHAESDHKGVAGSVDTKRALEEGRVRELFFTLSFLENHAADAEAAVRLAFESHASVEHVSGAAATRLEKAGGIGAQLRYAEPPLAGTLAPSANGAVA